MGPVAQSLRARCGRRGFGLYRFLRRLGAPGCVSVSPSKTRVVDLLTLPLPRAQNGPKSCLEMGSPDGLCCRQDHRAHGSTAGGREGGVFDIGGALEDGDQLAGLVGDVDRDRGDRAAAGEFGRLGFQDAGGDRL